MENTSSKIGSTLEEHGATLTLEDLQKAYDTLKSIDIPHVKDLYPDYEVPYVTSDGKVIDLAKTNYPLNKEC